MDTLIYLCIALSSSFAAPQQYVPPNPTESHQLQNPGAFNSLTTNTNNAFLPNTQSAQTNPPESHQFQNPRAFNSLSTNMNNAFLPNTQTAQTPNLPETHQLQNPGAFNSLTSNTNNAFIQNTQSTQTNPPESHQFQNPRAFNSLSTNVNNVFLPNTQPVQTSSTVTEPIQFNQDQSLNLPNTINNQNPSIIRVQETYETENELGQNIQDGSIDINNSGRNVLSNGFVSTYETSDGQIITSNINTNDNLNNPSLGDSTIGDFNQVRNNQVLHNIPNGSSNENIAHNVDSNGNENVILENDFTRVEMITVRSIVNSADSENGDFIPSQSGDFQNNEQFLSHQNSNSNQNLDNNGEFEANTQDLRAIQNNGKNENNGFINEQLENSQTHGQFISQQNTNSNQNIDNNSNVGVAQNLELTNEFNMNQVIQNSNDNQRDVIANKMIKQQTKENRSQCGRGLIHNARGTCVLPEVNRNIYVYRAPKMSQKVRNTSVEIPRPRLEYNIVFVRTPERNGNSDPIIVPPPQQKTLVYVLSKKKADGSQEIIEVPTGPKHNPEVYYVNYEEGDNPTLPGGIELQTALSSAVQSGQTVNDVLNESSLREDIAHGNITLTTNTGPKIEDTMFDGIGLHDTTGNNLANVLNIATNTEETSNNVGYANNQLDTTKVNNAQRFNVDGSEIDFINNDIGQNTVVGIEPLSASSLGGQYSATRGISNVGSFDGQNPTLEGISHQSVGRLNDQRPTTEGITHQSVGRLNGQIPTSVGIVHQSVGNFDGQRPSSERLSPFTGDSEVPVSFFNSGNIINSGNPRFMTNEEGHNLRQVMSTPPRQYNTY